MGQVIEKIDGVFYLFCLNIYLIAGLDVKSCLLHLKKKENVFIMAGLPVRLNAFTDSSLINICS